MYLYRGKEIGNWGRLTGICLKIIETGSPEEISDIIPHIRILRDKIFFAPLIRHLQNSDEDFRTVAALALGSLGDERCIEPLREAYFERGEKPQNESDPLDFALITALGEVPSARSVSVLNEILRGEVAADEVSQCSQLAVEALGQLAQQGVREAEEELRTLLSEKGMPLRAQAAAELSLSYWHRPREIPDDLLNEFYNLAAKEPDDLRTAARAALTSLAQLGSLKAESFLVRLSEP